VVPAITGQGYDGLEIAEGATARWNSCASTSATCQQQSGSGFASSLKFPAPATPKAWLWILTRLRKLVGGGD